MSGGDDSKSDGDVDATQSITQLDTDLPIDKQAGREAKSFEVRMAAARNQRYQILRMHARGGLGAVHVAFDNELNREVALKEILGERANDDEMRHRFLIEAEITGGLEHPGIVPVYGLGLHADGRPYYTMRFIKGESLKSAIDRFHATKQDASISQRSLEFRNLLRHFTDVCNAIEYAHGRNIIHRDLKPSNIILGKYGETLVVDWGLAKSLKVVTSGIATDEHPIQPARYSDVEATAQGTVVGTPFFMSPEQASGDRARVGFKTDIYSLGATLFSILTGEMPVKGTSHKEVLMATRNGNIRTPRSIDAAIPKALEAICLKALAFRPGDRYESARELGEEINRWTADLPTIAWKEPMTVRAQRWMRRHKTTMIAAIVASIVAAISLVAVLAIQFQANLNLHASNTQLKLSVQREARVNKELSEEQARTKSALEESEEARNQSDAVSDFLSNIFRSSDPNVVGTEVKVVDSLNRSVEELSRNFKGSDASRGKLFQALGETYYGLGLFDRARISLTKAYETRLAVFGAKSRLTIESRNTIAETELAAGNFEIAIPLLKEILVDFVDVYGEDAAETIGCYINLGLANLFAGRIDTAVTTLEDSLDRAVKVLGNGHSLTLTCLNNLALAYEDSNRYQDALVTHQSVLRELRQQFGDEHHDTLSSRNNIAAVELKLGHTEESLKIVDGLLPIAERVMGAQHPHTLIYAGRVADVYEAAGRWTDAEEVRRLQVERLRQQSDDDKPFFANAIDLLAKNLMKQLNWVKAESLLKESIQFRSEKIPEDWKRFDAMAFLGTIQMKQEQWDQAKISLLDAYAGLVASKDTIPVKQQIRISEVAQQIAELYRQTGQLEAAEEWKNK